MDHSLQISGTKRIYLTQVHSWSKVIVKCNSAGISFGDIIHLEISNLTLYGHYAPEDKAWLIYAAQTALLQHLIIERFELGFEGNSSLNHCAANNCTIHLSCPPFRPNIKSSLTLYKSIALHSAIISDKACKELELDITWCTIDRYYSEKKYPPDITFEIGPSANLHVTIEDTWVDGQLALVGLEANNKIRLNIHRSEMKISYMGSMIRIELSDIARKCNLIVQITDSKISETKLGPGLNLDSEIEGIFDNTIEILLVNTSFSHGRDAVISNNLIFFDVKRPQGNRTVLRITIEKCSFLNNKVAVEIKVVSNINIRFEMVITDSTFYGNENAIFFRRKEFEIAPVLTPITPYIFVSLTNVTLENNSPHLFKSGVIGLYSIDMLTLKDCKIINNRGTAIEAYHSSVTLSGDTLFNNNTSIRGGALLLHESYLYFTVLSNISFFNNYASDIGGSIYLKQRPHIQFDWLDYPPCFHQIKSLLDRPVLSLNFKSNFASGGGDDIYSGSLYGVCKYLDIPEKFPNTIIDSIFHFQDKSMSYITSDPTRVCLCNDQGIPQCADIEYIYRELPPRYPGEVFTLPAVVVGNDFGTVPGVVYTKILWTNANNITDKHYLPVQDFRDQTRCSLLQLSIPSELTNIDYELQLYVNENIEERKKSSVEKSIVSYKKDKELLNDLLSQHVYISLALQDCPTGFILTGMPPYICTCHPTLEDNGITVCIITNHTGWVYRSGTVWVSDSFNGNETHSFVVHQYCPYDYCKQDSISVDLQFPEMQCSFNHSGVLCGGCYGNLSLALGTSKCLPCDNRYVSLLLVFILAGVALVFFIKVLDVTVAKGTINGLIFYANIVWASKSIIFPTTETLHPVQQILHTFIYSLAEPRSRNRDMFY